MTKKRKLLAAVIICVALITGSTILWQMGQVAEAAIIDPHPGLAGWWRFDEGTGTIAEDSSGNGNDGTINGAIWATGKYDNALQFNGNGIGNYGSVNIGNVLNIGSSDSFSISLWVNFNDVASRAFCVIKGGLDNAQQDPYEGYGISVYGSALAFEVKDGTQHLSIGSSVASGNWQYVVGVCNRTSNTMMLYVNGTQLAFTSIAGLGSLSNSYDLRFGSYTWIDPNYGNLNGVLDEVQIYNRALSAVEIQESFQKGPDFSSKLLAKVPKGTTQVIVTVSWQGIGSIYITVESPEPKIYTEDEVPMHEKTVYSTSDGTSSMLNIKRLSITVTALSSDENWYVILEYNDVQDYRMTVELQK